MTTYASTDDIVDLQIKIAHLERMCDDLNAVIITQDKHIRDLQDQLRLMYRYLQNHANDDMIAPFDLLADRPPHY